MNYNIMTVDIIGSIKRKMRMLHNQIIDNLDNSFNPIDSELDKKLDEEIDALNDRLKRFKKSNKDSFSDMMLRVYD